MKKASKPMTKAAAPAATRKKPSFFALPMDEHPLRFAIAGGVMLLFALFYFSQKLFEAYNFNDFGEYYLRAQD